jgi:hypothetical protein
MRLAMARSPAVDKCLPCNIKGAVVSLPIDLQRAQFLSVGVASYLQLKNGAPSGGGPPS